MIQNFPNVLYANIKKKQLMITIILIILIFNQLYLFASLNHVKLECRVTFDKIVY